MTSQAAPAAAKSVVLPQVAAPAVVKPQGFVSRLLRRPLALLALAWLLFMAACAIFGPQWAPFDPLDQDLLAIKQLPNAEHWLGSDALGRDILSRLLFGTRPTLLGLVQALSVVAVLGTSIGMTAGYFGGWWDKLVLQFQSLLQAMPVTVILLAVLAIFGQTMLPAMVTLGILGTAGVSRVIRSATLSVREELYIAAARISGLSDWRIIASHVFPRILGPVIVQLSLFAAIAVIVQTGINFLGLGIPPPAPTWGGMIFEASSSLNDFPWLLVPSGGTVATTILAFGLLGDSLRDTAVETWARGGTRQSAKTAALVPISDAPANSALSLRNLTITTGEGESRRALVDGIGFDLAAGETLGIVGESGSGKTLSILSLLGLLPGGTAVASGTAKVAGKDIDLTDEAQLATLRGRGLGMIFQEPMAALDPCFTVGHHIEEVLRLQGGLKRRDIKAKVISLLEQVKINDPIAVARKYPHQISGGMAQRVGIARALASEPRVLLADEPTTALDVTVQAEILELLRSLQKARNMAVVIVTHDWGVVADICDRAMVLYKGKMLETANVFDLFQRPQHPYTQALLKANPHGGVPGQPLPTVQDQLAMIAGSGR